MLAFGLAWTVGWRLALPSHFSWWALVAGVAATVVSAVLMEVFHAQITSALDRVGLGPIQWLWPGICGGLLALVLRRGRAGFAAVVAAVWQAAFVAALLTWAALRSPTDFIR
jgi:hypothetical protein